MQGLASATPPQLGAVRLRLRLIGHMEAWTMDSQSVLPSGRKTRALLAIMAMAAPRPVLRSRAAETLWSRRPEEYGRASLRQEIHRLHEALGKLGPEVLAVSRDHLGLRPGAVWIDVDEVLRATPSRPMALGLFDGELLEDLEDLDATFDAWLGGERERLRDRARSLGEVLLREQTEPGAMIVSAQQLLAIDRSHEGAWRTLMRAHHALGERGMAIQAYERCRAVLADQLDAQPSPETQRLLAELKADAANQSPPRPVGVETMRPYPLREVSGRSIAGRARMLRSDSEALMHRDGAVRVQPTGGQLVASLVARSSPARSGARLGVLPLKMVSTLPSDAHLSEALATELTGAIGRFRWTSAVSLGTLGRLAEQNDDVAGLRRAMGLDLVLDGTVQRATAAEGERLRVSLRLLDLRSGNQVVWSRKFDRPADDLLAWQDELVAQAAAQVEPEILMLESRRADLAATARPTAYELTLRALLLMQVMERTQFMEAGTLLSQAIALDPEHVPAHVQFAFWHLLLVAQVWSGDQRASMARAEEIAERAVMLDPQDARALTIAGHVRSYLQRRVREGLGLHARALTLNPNLSTAWSLSALSACYFGDHEDAERRVLRYKQLNPLHPYAFYLDHARVMVALMRRQYRLAIEVGRNIAELNPLFLVAMKPYLAALGHEGEAQEAEAVRGRVLSLHPGFTVGHFLSVTPFERDEDRTHYAEGLRRAGVPE